MLVACSRGLCAGAPGSRPSSLGALATTFVGLVAQAAMGSREDVRASFEKFDQNGQGGSGLERERGLRAVLEDDRRVFGRWVRVTCVDP